jgi:metallo-beta-lactamase class B
MSKSSLLYVVVFVIALSDSTFGQNTITPPYVNESWVRAYEPFRIAGNLYWVGTYDLGCYLITTPQGHVLINTGLAESVPMIKASMASLGFRFQDIKILLTTQAHYDHVAGMEEIKRMTGASMMIHEADSEVLSDGGASDYILGGAPSFEPVEADKLLRDGDVVKLGDMKINVLHHPGHTKGSTSFMLEVKDENRSWKVLIANMPSILDGTKLSGMPAYPKVGEDFKYSLNVMKKLQFDLWVASHASQFKLHDKRKPGEKYHPGKFNDRPLYEASINRVAQQYEMLLHAEKQKP